MTSSYIGIDPGKTGAMVMVTDTSLCIHDSEDVYVNSDMLREWMATSNIKLVALEIQHPYPGQGISSTGKIMRAFGEWRGILAALGLRWIEPRPVEWMKGLIPPKLKKEKGKGASLEIVRRMFPGYRDMWFKRAGDHGRSDATLLAVYAQHYDGGDRNATRPRIIYHC